MAIHQDFGSDLQRILCEATSKQSVRRAGFDHPTGHLAVVVFHVDMHPGVRIDPFHLGDRTPQLERPIKARRIPPQETSVF